MKDNRIYEQSTGHAKSIAIKTLNKVSNSLCKIKINKTKFSGFFLKIPKDQNFIYLLVTSYEVISNQSVDEKKKIKIRPEIGNIKQKIILDKNERKIYCLPDKNITAIEILEKDNLFNKIQFLSYDPECKTIEYGQYLSKKKDIFILHYPKGKDLECNCGMFDGVKIPKQFQFLHTLYNETNSKGSPILLLDEESNEEALVIGVHISFVNGNNIGTFINVLIENIIGKKYNDLKEESGVSKYSKIEIK